MSYSALYVLHSALGILYWTVLYGLSALYVLYSALDILYWTVLYGLFSTLYWIQHSVYCTGLFCMGVVQHCMYCIQHSVSCTGLFCMDCSALSVLNSALGVLYWTVLYGLSALHVLYSALGILYWTVLYGLFSTIYTEFSTRCFVLDCSVWVVQHCMYCIQHSVSCTELFCMGCSALYLLTSAFGVF